MGSASWRRARPPDSPLREAITGWAFYLLMVFGGLASIVATTTFAYRRLCALGP